MYVSLQTKGVVYPLQGFFRLLTEKAKGLMSQPRRRETRCVVKRALYHTFLTVGYPRLPGALYWECVLSASSAAAFLTRSRFVFRLGLSPYPLPAPSCSGRADL